MSNPSDKTFEVTCSDGFYQWLADHHASLAITTYQTGKLFLIGRGESHRLSIFERSFDRCMGMWSDGGSLWMTTRYQLWRFEDMLAGRAHPDGYDRLYVPQMSFVTGDLDIHDVSVLGNGQPIFVNTLFSCLATTTETHSFIPAWQPSFLPELAPIDAAHLNGLAMRDGHPAFVTAAGETTEREGWRACRRDGGVIIDVDGNETICRGLSMPHSPRWFDGRLWLLDSGSGRFGYLDGGVLETVAFCPGYARGLSFVDNHAVVGLSLLRDKTFTDLPLGDALRRQEREATCGIQVFDLSTGKPTEWIKFGGMVNELYDVVVLCGVKRPMALGFKTDEIERIVSMG